ncbi:hypothetical protein [Methanosarcina spelaei]|nr:hypothetical protein [Methanosarcina spelaei]
MRRNVQAVVNEKLPAQKIQVLSNSKKDRSNVCVLKDHLITWVAECM